MGGVYFIDPVKDYPLKKLIDERNRWASMVDEDDDYGDIMSHRLGVITKYDAEIERRKQMTKIGELLYLGSAEVLNETKRCRVSYRSGAGFEHLRKDHANVSLYGDDGYIDSTLSIHVSQVEQYLLDHGVDPNGTWTNTITREVI